MTASTADAALAPLTLAELLAEPIATLTERAHSLEIRNAAALSRDALINSLLDARAALHSEVVWEGESMEFLLEKIRQAESNQAFLESMNG